VILFREISEAILAGFLLPSLTKAKVAGQALARRLAIQTGVEIEQLNKPKDTAPAARS